MVLKLGCKDDDCLGSSLKPPTLSPSLIKNLGTQFCKIDLVKLSKDALQKKKKAAPHIEKRQLKKKNPKDNDDAYGNKQTKKKSKK
ncbi:unnamed protein product [Urochloa humidicola]